MNASKWLRRVLVVTIVLGNILLVAAAAVLALLLSAASRQAQDLGEAAKRQSETNEALITEGTRRDASQAAAIEDAVARGFAAIRADIDEAETPVPPAAPPTAHQHSPPPPRPPSLPPPPTPTTTARPLPGRACRLSALGFCLVYR